jgi:hypothetical protein
MSRTLYLYSDYVARRTNVHSVASGLSSKTGLRRGRYTDISVILLLSVEVPVGLVTCTAIM